MAFGWVSVILAKPQFQLIFILSNLLIINLISLADMNEIANFVNGDISNEDNEGYRAGEEMGSVVNKLKQMVHSFVTSCSHLIIRKQNIPSITNPPYAINNFGKELPLF